MLPKNRFRNVNGLRVEVKTDGNAYVVTLISRELLGIMNYMVNTIKALIQDKGQEWVTLEIPLRNMISDIDRAEHSIQFDVDGSNNSVKLVAVLFGIYSHNQTEGNFEVFLRKINLLFNTSSQNKLN